MTTDETPERPEATEPEPSAGAAEPELRAGLPPVEVRDGERRVRGQEPLPEDETPEGAP